MTLALTDVRRSVLDSQAFCRRVARTQARNFYYGLKLLPEPQRSAMFVLYAYMRRADDLADQTADAQLSVRQANLQRYRSLTHAVLRGETWADDDWPGWPAFAAMVRQFALPVHLFDSMVDGQIHDLTPVRMETFQQLCAYCYQVAGVVGLASVHIWGFTGGRPMEQLAIERGLAFQLTNILRDLREDAQLGRSYLPREDLQRFGVSTADISEGRNSPAFHALMQFQVRRAAEYYQRSAPLDAAVSAQSRRTLYAMTEIYRAILLRIARNPAQPLYGKVRLGHWAKTAIVVRACLRETK
ncbi:MAG: phytoene/squalene synthase family protein [Phycisphaerae bacterium]|nr:phytoene/squalene synthase family protein [Phycisphaerae bacterium]